MVSKATKRLYNKLVEAFQLTQFKVTFKGSKSDQIKWENTLGDPLCVE